MYPRKLHSSVGWASIKNYKQTFQKYHLATLSRSFQLTLEYGMNGLNETGGKDDLMHGLGLLLL